MLDFSECVIVIVIVYGCVRVDVHGYANVAPLWMQRNIAETETVSGGICLTKKSQTHDGEGTQYHGQRTQKQVAKIDDREHTKDI